MYVPDTNTTCSVHIMLLVHLRFQGWPLGVGDQSVCLSLGMPVSPALSVAWLPAVLGLELRPLGFLPAPLACPFGILVQILPKQLF